MIRLMRKLIVHHPNVAIVAIGLSLILAMFGGIDALERLFGAECRETASPVRRAPPALEPAPRQVNLADVPRPGVVRMVWAVPSLSGEVRVMRREIDLTEIAVRENLDACPLP